MIFPKLQVPIGLLYNRPDQNVQILGLVFLTLFTVVLLLQLGSMLFHRWGTIVEILASTRILRRHHKYRKANMTIQEAVDLIKEMELEKRIDLHDTNTTTTNSNVDTTSDEPEPDYLDVEEDDILKHAIPTPFSDGMRYAHFDQSAHYNGVRNSAFSPRQNALKPLQSLDDIIIRKFKNRERDANFKKRVKLIQDSNKVISPNTAYYNGQNYV
jgi:hypothetical protein